MADLNDFHRTNVEAAAKGIVAAMVTGEQSLAIAREALINAFDEAASNGE